MSGILTINIAQPWPDLVIRNKLSATPTLHKYQYTTRNHE